MKIHAFSLVGAISLIAIATADNPAAHEHPKPCIGHCHQPIHAEVYQNEQQQQQKQQKHGHYVPMNERDAQGNIKGEFYGQEEKYPDSHQYHQQQHQDPSYINTMFDKDNVDNDRKGPVVMGYDGDDEQDQEAEFITFGKVLEILERLALRTLQALKAMAPNPNDELLFDEEVELEHDPEWMSFNDNEADEQEGDGGDRNFGGGGKGEDILMEDLSANGQEKLTSKFKKRLNPGLEKLGVKSKSRTGHDHKQGSMKRRRRGDVVSNVNPTKHIFKTLKSLLLKREKAETDKKFEQNGNKDNINNNNNNNNRDNNPVFHAQPVQDRQENNNNPSRSFSPVAEEIDDQRRSQGAAYGYEKENQNEEEPIFSILPVEKRAVPTPEVLQVNV